MEGGRKIWYRDTESLDMCSELCFNKEGCNAVNYDVCLYLCRYVYM